MSPSCSFEPQVSLLMVARNTAPYIGAAIHSARRQSFDDIEIIVVDDGSTDDTRTIALSHAAEDSRVRVLDGPRAGLAAVRNASLAAARGRWAAIFDSDDLLHSRHIERLVKEARRSSAEIVATNMVRFTVNGGITRTALFADSQAWREPRQIGLADYIRCNSAFGDSVCAGYLKPLLAVEFLRRHAIAYDPRLRIAEDYDLVARMLAHGARFSYLPRPSYFYRRHDASTSHRQSEIDLVAMLAAADAVLDADSGKNVHAAAAARKGGIATLLRHTRAISHLKALRLVSACRALGWDGAAWRLLANSALEGITRRLVSRLRSHPFPAPVALIIGEIPPEDPAAEQLASLTEGGLPIVMRAAPTNDAERANLVHGLPPLLAVLRGNNATEDDAEYALIALAPSRSQAPGPSTSAISVHAAVDFRAHVETA